MKTETNKQSISLKVLNEILSQDRKYFLNEERGHIGIGDDADDGSQGDYNETFKFYKHPEMPENTFLRVTYQTDSYGDNENITEMKFVEGKAKTITVFEPIK